MTVKQAGAVVGLLAGSLGLWKGTRDVFEHLADQRMQRLLTIERLNEMQVHDCEVHHKGNWFQGECRERRKP